ncbi:hypothetical protein QYE76_065504 [Lolium multiflorum]|uniref:Uncharacterized protein n=1 Tax=Lolium multiflorum TaxID=4521 RepID=A0AAD8S900_LOLMU|nr:hypothetical protein QYE76_065504 [Lolium multiflorum]
MYAQLCYAGRENSGQHGRFMSRTVIFLQCGTTTAYRMACGVCCPISNGLLFGLRKERSNYDAMFLCRLISTNYHSDRILNCSLIRIDVRVAAGSSVPSSGELFLPFL